MFCISIKAAVGCTTRNHNYDRVRPFFRCVTLTPHNRATRAEKNSCWENDAAPVLILGQRDSWVRERYSLACISGDIEPVNPSQPGRSEVSSAQLGAGTRLETVPQLVVPCGRAYASDEKVGPPLQASISVVAYRERNRKTCLPCVIVSFQRSSRDRAGLKYL